MTPLPNPALDSLTYHANSVALALYYELPQEKIDARIDQLIRFWRHAGQRSL